MVTPAKGDYKGVPITLEALTIVNGVGSGRREKAGNQCKSYGAAAVMRLPARIHITWQDDNTMRRRHRRRYADAALPFAQGPVAAGPPTWQGHRLRGGNDRDAEIPRHAPDHSTS